MRTTVAMIGLLAGLVRVAHADPQFYGSWQNIENGESAAVKNHLP